jgi:hypothetical protein
MIGSKWGTKVVNGGASATLSFQLGKGLASIGGSTQVKNYATHTGDTGEEPDLTVPKKWRKYNINRVNAFYRSSHEFFWLDTGSNEGRPDPEPGPAARRGLARVLLDGTTSTRHVTA